MPYAPDDLFSAFHRHLLSRYHSLSRQSNCLFARTDLAYPRASSTVGSNGLMAVDLSHMNHRVRRNMGFWIRTGRNVMSVSHLSPPVVERVVCTARGADRETSRARAVATHILAALPRKTDSGRVIATQELAGIDGLPYGVEQRSNLLRPSSGLDFRLPLRDGIG